MIGPVKPADPGPRSPLGENKTAGRQLDVVTTWGTRAEQLPGRLLSRSRTQLDQTHILTSDNGAQISGDMPPDGHSVHGVNPQRPKRYEPLLGGDPFH